nr:Predicted ATPase [Raoultella sp. NCTC 9187]
MPEEMKRRILTENRFSFKFEHEMEGGEYADIDIEDESAGTCRLFELTPALISGLLINRVLIIDEIDHSMHPHLAALLIRLFNDSEINKAGSQLIFTTHNIELMKSDRMRRDQIWFTEKKNGATELYSLDDFDKDKVKANSPFNKWYDEGRFGGTPSINYMKIKNYLVGVIGDAPEETDLNVFGDIDDIPEDLR